MYDLIIVGMGISGISAAIYAKRANLNVLLLEGSAPGGILNNIPNIENYPGIKEISGPDFACNLFEEIKKLKIEYKLETVTDVILDSIKTIKTKNNVYQSKYLLIATGRKPKLLGIKEEEKYLGKGISTCALCDGAFYKGKSVAVVGGGSSALTEALFLAELAKKVYLINRSNELRGEEILQNRVKQTNNIELIKNLEIKELVVENDTFKGIVLSDNSTIEISALFLYIGSTPNTKMLENTGLKMDNGYIIVNENQETNIEGVYASGDVTKKAHYQLIHAASEGASAVINITKSYKN